MRFIILSRGNIAIVDDEDHESLSRRVWFTSSSGYAVANQRASKGKYRTIHMHRMVLGIQGRKKVFVDHINRDKLDNRKCNLRIANCSQNGANSGPRKNNKTGFKGVSFCPDRGLYIAQIRCGQVAKNLGRFKTPEEAAAAYDYAALKLWGEYARTNFQQ